MRDRLYAAAGILFIAGALWLLLAGRGESVDLDTLEAPQLVLITPQEGEEIRGPLAIEFDPGMRLVPGPHGWGDRRLHLHLTMNRREYMPGRSDIEPLEGGRYRWTLPPFTDGTYRLRLIWSTTDHGAIPHGASEEVTVRIAGGGASAGTDAHPSAHR